MIKARQILAALTVVIILSGWGGLVLAAGKSCTKGGTDCDAAGEQCCCCFGDGTCDKGQANEVEGKGVCFPKEIKSVGPKPLPVQCSGVVCPLSRRTSVEDFIKEAVNYIFYISIIAAPLMIIIGAFLFLTSGGNPKQAKLGGSVIQWTAIGLAIILFAKGITAIIKMILVG